MPPEDKNRIEDLKRAMYGRSAPEVRTRRKLRYTDMNVTGPEVKTDWEHPPEEDIAPEGLNQEYKDHSMSFLKKLLIGSIVFFIAAVGLGAYLFLNGANLISASNIDVSISGPVSVPGGTPVTLTVTVTNKNSVELESADLEMDFPSGTTDPTDTTRSLETFRQLLGNIAPGASVTKQISAVIFGQENTQKVVTAVVTYGIKGSSSVFTKEQTYDVLVNSSPVILSVSSVDQITSGQPFDMTVDVKSNSQDTLKNIILKASYPFGYSFVSSSPSPLSDKATWDIGDMSPGSDQKVVIHGALTGSDSDLQAFHFTIGAQSQSDPLTIGTAYTDTEQDVTIEKPFISVATYINNDDGTGDYVGQFGRPLEVILKWANNLPETVSNVTITAHLSGSAYAPSQVSAQGGYFRSSTNDIVWSQQTDPELASVASGATGEVSFSVNPADTSTALNPVIDPGIAISTTVSGDRTSESGVPGETAPAVRNVKVSSNVNLSGSVLRTAGPFTNTGPVPPVVGQKTTYTIAWTVDNTSNAVSGAQVTAVLPPYVTWLGNVSPSTEDVTYDKNSGTVTWNIGSVDTYTLSSSRRRQAYFQVAFMPSVDQANSEPTLIGEATLSATDSWTGASLSSKQSFLTTSFSTDPAFQSGDQTVKAAGN